MNALRRVGRMVSRFAGRVAGRFVAQLVGAASLPALAVGIGCFGFGGSGEVGGLRQARADDAQVALGRELFTHVWKPHDPLCHGGDGLGPFFNEKSCVACHHLGGTGGGGRDADNVHIVTATSDPWRITHLGRPAGVATAQFLQLFPDGLKEPFVLHRFGLAPAYHRWQQDVVKAGLNGFSSVNGVKTVDGYALDDLDLDITQRNTSALFGAGEIDRISAETLEQTAARQSKEVRGRVARLGDGSVGRFGWKSQNATLADFNMNACAVEIGLDNPVHQQPIRHFSPRPKAAGLDLTQEQCDALTAFTASLPAPRQDPAARLDPKVIEGERTFLAIGCAECHVPNLGAAKGIYSDLLLHQVGTGAGIAYYGGQGPAVSVAEGDPVLADEWRTPPLWGCADSAPYLHDGRGRTLGAAIEAHTQQASASGNRYRSLTPEMKNEVLAFLGSLRAPKETPPGGMHANPKSKIPDPK